MKTLDEINQSIQQMEIKLHNLKSKILTMEFGEDPEENSLARELIGEAITIEVLLMSLKENLLGFSRKNQ